MGDECCKVWRDGDRKRAHHGERSIVAGVVSRCPGFALVRGKMVDGAASVLVRWLL